MKISKRDGAFFGDQHKRKGESKKQNNTLGTFLKYTT